MKSKIEIELWQMNERFATLLGKTALECRVLSCEESKEQMLNIIKSPH